MVLIFAMLICTITYIGTHFFNKRPWIKVIKYYDNDTRIVKNIITKKYYIEYDFEGWSHFMEPPLNYIPDDLNNYQSFKNDYYLKKSDRYKFENKKKK